MYLRVEISASKLSLEGVLQEIADDTCGAQNIFLGVTRDHHDGRAVTGLEYHCYHEMALAELEKVARMVGEAHQITRLVVLHRIGVVAIGETSLIVAAASAHRHQALAGTQDFIDQLKRDVPIWKKESFADGSLGWVEGSEIRDTQ